MMMAALFRSGVDSGLFLGTDTVARSPFTRRHDPLILKAPGKSPRLAVMRLLPTGTSEMSLRF
jgi:hypothetical protein